jgi:photosystem II stability/assembly factor-like uncharacterized protein
MHFRPCGRKKPWQFFILALVCLLAGGLAWIWPAPPASSGNPPSSATSWVVGNSSDGYGLILHTTDGGAHWLRQIYTPHPDIREASLLHVHGNPPHTVWVVGAGTVMRSTDDGETWEFLRPPDTTGLFDFNGIDALNSSTVWLTEDQGGIYLFDGSQWQKQPSGADGYEIMRISALDGQTAWATGWATLPYLPQGLILFKQEGQNWTPQAFAPVVQLVDVSFPRPQRARSLPAV